MRINDKETKFNLGDTVFYVNFYNDIVSNIISTILISDNSEINYKLKDGCVITESQVCATAKEAKEKLKKMNVKVYLSGAIANDKDYISKFMTAKEEVKKMGFSVLTPIETDESMHDEGVKECMFAAIELLRQADVMLLLDNPETIESKGVQIEKELARYCNIPIVSDYIELDSFYIYKFGENKKEKNLNT